MTYTEVIDTLILILLVVWSVADRCNLYIRTPAWDHPGREPRWDDGSGHEPVAVKHPFTVGQRFTGNQGVGFEVFSENPLQVICVEARILPNWSHGPGSRFVLGKVYRLVVTETGFHFRHEDFVGPLPWVSITTSGQIQVH